eukprot:2743683-Heterocapsa_arctica.AAC.1
MRWENALERFEPKWEDLASDRETWISHRHSFVLKELAYCQCKNAGRLGPATLPVLAIADRPPDLPCLPILAPRPVSSFPPLPSLFSFSDPCIPSYWGAYLIQDSLAHVSVSCVGNSQTVINEVLGLHCCPDPVLNMLRPRLLRTLLAISSSIKMRPCDVLSHFPCAESNRAVSLSLLAISLGSSVESG